MMGVGIDACVQDRSVLQHIAGVCICKCKCKCMQDDRCSATSVGGLPVGGAAQADHCSAGVHRDGWSGCCCLYAGSPCIAESCKEMCRDRVCVVIGVEQVSSKMIGVGSPREDECLCRVGG